MMMNERLTAVVSVIAASQRWPDVCSYSDTDIRKLRKSLSAVRPSIETGYENMLVVRLATEQLKVTQDVTPEDILCLWSPRYRDETMATIEENREALIDFFGATRDGLIAKDRDAWLALNEVYPAVKTAFLQYLNSAEYYIVTTKQSRFIDAIMRNNGLSPPPLDRVFDLDNPIKGKPNVLKHLISTLGEDTTIHFVEDRFETLEAVERTSGLENVRLYLVDWGYNTEIQRLLCGSSSRITLLTPADFLQLTKTLTT
jgi:phosphoglycolate phosphatase-like HAD superfamily hydrolase